MFLIFKVVHFILFYLLCLELGRLAAARRGVCVIILFYFILLPRLPGCLAAEPMRGLRDRTPVPPVAVLGLVGRVPRGETSCRAGRAVGAVELQSFFLRSSGEMLSAAV